MEGAEVLAMLLGDVFNPLMDTIYGWGGFIVTLAGDAFIAVFPHEEANAHEQNAHERNAHEQNAHVRAAMAAWQISEHVRNNPTRWTRFGHFQFSIKVSVASGCVNWGLVQASDAPSALAQQQNAVCYFIGEAIDRCLEIDQFTPGNSVFLTADVHRQLPAQLFPAQAIGPYRELLHAQFPRAQGLGAMRAVQRVAPVEKAQHRSLAGEFRQVATVFVNFQHLWSPAAASYFQQKLFHLIDKYDGFLSLFGRVGALDVGCTLLLFWGAPKNHENDLFKALSFALELRATAPAPLRIGLTYNLAYAGLAGSPQFTRYTCFGSSVNRAARQVMTANWGEILLDPKTAQQVGPRFEVTEGGWRRFKGFDEKQQVFLLHQQRESIGAPTFQAPMVGRQRELSQMWQAIQQLFQHKFGGIILVSGEAGIGKSRLVYALQMHTKLFGQAKRRGAASANQRASIAWFHCPVDEARLLPLNPFRHFLHCYFGQNVSENESLNGERFSARLDTLIHATSDRQLAQSLARSRPYLASLMGLPWENPLAQQLEPQILRDNWLEALKTLIKAVSQLHPLVIHIDDAHWLDAETTFFLNRLTHNVDGCPFLLLITMRSPHNAAQKQGATDVYDIMAADCRKSIHLAPLDAESLHILAIHFLDGAVARSLVNVLAASSQGNRFFAEQIMLYWRESNLLDWGDQGWCLRIQEHDLFPVRAPALSANARTV
ncbi:MAG: AAA family ATPase, partial [Caldilineaceae bacterium]|nr:AAA family ATPase [Caldilineaceae bacterium]